MRAPLYFPGGAFAVTSFVVVVAIHQKGGKLFSPVFRAISIMGVYALFLITPTIIFFQ